MRTLSVHERSQGDWGAGGGGEERDGEDGGCKWKEEGRGVGEQVVRDWTDSSVLFLEAEGPFPLACTTVFRSLLPGCPVQGTHAELVGGVMC